MLHSDSAFKFGTINVESLCYVVGAVLLSELYVIHPDKCPVIPFNLSFSYLWVIKKKTNSIFFQDKFVFQECVVFQTTIVIKHMNSN